MKELILYLLTFLAGMFVCAYFFIPRFRVGFHNALIAGLNGLDKALAVKKKEDKK